MATNCKLVFGYKDHTDYWNTESVYYRHYDGYSEAIIPLLQQYVDTIYKTPAECDEFVKAMNNSPESQKYGGHQFEELDGLYDGVTRPDYIYYIDTSDRAEIRCTVLTLDMEYYRMYEIDNYKVDKVLTLQP